LRPAHDKAFDTSDMIFIIRPQKLARLTMVSTKPRKTINNKRVKSATVGLMRPWTNAGRLKRGIRNILEEMTAH